MKPKFLSRQSYRVLTLGAATEDRIIQYENGEMLHWRGPNGERSYLLLQEGQKIEITHEGIYSGGGATNTAVCFQKLGFQASVFCKMGQDEASKMILADLSAHGVNVSHVLQTPTEKTGHAFVVPSLKGDRTVFAYRGANANIGQDEWPWAAMADHDLIYITSLSGRSAHHFSSLVHEAKRLKKWVAINPGTSQLKSGVALLKQALDAVDVVILNSMEAQGLMSAFLKEELEGIYFSLPVFFKMILDLGPRWVVVTHGEEGVYVADRQVMYYHPAHATQVVNTLGAGDAFGATFVAALMAHQSTEDAIRCGVLNSSAVVACADAKSGLLSEAELKAQWDVLPKDLLHQYDFSKLS